VTQSIAGVTAGDAATADFAFAVQGAASFVLNLPCLSAKQCAASVPTVATSTSTSRRSVLASTTTATVTYYIGGANLNTAAAKTALGGAQMTAFLQAAGFPTAVVAAPSSVVDATPTTAPTGAPSLLPAAKLLTLTTIIGIAVGGCAGVCVCCACLVMYFRRRRGQGADAQWRDGAPQDMFVGVSAGSGAPAPVPAYATTGAAFAQPRGYYGQQPQQPPPYPGAPQPRYATANEVGFI